MEDKSNNKATSPDSSKQRQSPNRAPSPVSPPATVGSSQPRPDRMVSKGGDGETVVLAEVVGEVTKSEDNFVGSSTGRSRSADLTSSGEFLGGGQSETMKAEARAGSGSQVVVDESSTNPKTGVEQGVSVSEPVERDSSALNIFESIVARVRDAEIGKQLKVKETLAQLGMSADEISYFVGSLSIADENPTPPSGHAGGSNRPSSKEILEEDEEEPKYAATRDKVMRGIPISHHIGQTGESERSEVGGEEEEPEGEPSDEDDDTECDPYENLQGKGGLILPSKVDVDDASRAGASIEYWDVVPGQVGLRAERDFGKHEYVGTLRLLPFVEGQSKQQYAVYDQEGRKCNGAGAGCAKFANHSCYPNCRFRFDEVHDMGGQLTLATKRRVRKGDWLTVDYRWGSELPPGVTERTPCYCGHPSCRGALETSADDACSVTSGESIASCSTDSRVKEEPDRRASSSTHRRISKPGLVARKASVGRQGYPPSAAAASVASMSTTAWSRRRSSDERGGVGAGEAAPRASGSVEEAPPRYSSVMGGGSAPSTRIGQRESVSTRTAVGVSGQAGEPEERVRAPSTMGERDHRERETEVRAVERGGEKGVRVRVDEGANVVLEGRRESTPPTREAVVPPSPDTMYIMRQTNEALARREAWADETDSSSEGAASTSSSSHASADDEGRLGQRQKQKVGRGSKREKRRERRKGRKKDAQRDKKDARAHRKYCSASGCSCSGSGSERGAVADAGGRGRGPRTDERQQEIQQLKQQVAALQQQQQFSQQHQVNAPSPDSMTSLPQQPNFSPSVQSARLHQPHATTSAAISSQQFAAMSQHERQQYLWERRRQAAANVGTRRRRQSMGVMNRLEEAPMDDGPGPLDDHAFLDWFEVEMAKRIARSGSGVQSGVPPLAATPGVAERAASRHTPAVADHAAAAVGVVQSGRKGCYDLYGQWHDWRSEPHLRQSDIPRWKQRHPKAAMEWLRRYERAAMVEGWTPRQAIDALVVAMPDAEAEAWATQTAEVVLRQPVDTMWSTFARLFENQFAPKNHHTKKIAATAYHSVKQSPVETVDAYAARVRELSETLLAHMKSPPEEWDVDLLTTFQKGLRSELQSKFTALGALAPSTFQKAVDYARQQEEDLQEQVERDPVGVNVGKRGGSKKAAVAAAAVEVEADSKMSGDSKASAGVGVGAEANVGQGVDERAQLHQTAMEQLQVQHTQLQQQQWQMQQTIMQQQQQIQQQLIQQQQMAALDHHQYQDAWGGGQQSEVMAASFSHPPSHPDWVDRMQQPAVDPYLLQQQNEAVVMLMEAERGGRPFAGACHICQQPGHRAVDCSQRVRVAPGSSGAGAVICWKCGEPGHTSPQCVHQRVWCTRCQSDTHNDRACEEPARYESRMQRGRAGQYQRAGQRPGGDQRNSAARRPAARPPIRGARPPQQPFPEQVPVPQQAAQPYQQPPAPYQQPVVQYQQQPGVLYPPQPVPVQRGQQQSAGGGGVTSPPQQVPPSQQQQPARPQLN